jgi:hypothetical protein
MPPRRSLKAAPNHRYPVTTGMYKRLLAAIEANHTELVQLRRTVDANFRRVAEMQIELDRLKTRLIGVP